MDVRNAGSVASDHAYQMDDFEEQERLMLAEELRESKQHLSTTQLELARCNAEREALRRLVADNRRIRQVMQDELDSVKLQSRNMLLSQGDELGQSVIAVGHLAGHVTELYEELQNAEKKFCTSHEVVEQDGSTSPSRLHISDSNETKVDPDIQPSIGGVETGDDNIQDSNTGIVTVDDNTCSNNNSDSCNSQPKQANAQFCSSVGSAFNPIRKKGAQLRSDNDAAVAMKTVATVPDLSSLEELPVNKQIDEVTRMLALIISLLAKVKVGVTSSHTSNLSRLQSLVSAVSDAQSSHQVELAELQESVAKNDDVQREMSLKVRDLERELGEAHGELTTQEERLTGLRELLQQRTQRLEDINDQHILVQRLKQEVDHMTRLSQRKEGENAIITDTLHSTIVRLEEVKGQLAGGAKDGMDAETNYIRENLVLKKEVSHLKQRILHTQDDATAVTTKANKRMKTLENNWRHAEQELHRLDLLMEHTFNILRNHTDAIKEWDDAAIILQELTRTIDGSVTPVSH